MATLLEKSQEILNIKKEKILPENIKKDTVIFDITGTLEELKSQEKTVAPTIEEQIIAPDAGNNGLSKVTVSAVTSAIDENIKAENIKEGINILGVDGKLTSSKNTGATLFSTEDEMNSSSDKTAPQLGIIYKDSNLQGIYERPKDLVSAIPSGISETVINKYVSIYNQISPEFIYDNLADFYKPWFDVQPTSESFPYKVIFTYADMITVAFSNYKPQIYDPSDTLFGYQQAIYAYIHTDGTVSFGAVEQLESSRFYSTSIDIFYCNVDVTYFSNSGRIFKEKTPEPGYDTNTWALAKTQFDATAEDVLAGTCFYGKDGAKIGTLGDANLTNKSGSLYGKMAMKYANEPVLEITDSNKQELLNLSVIPMDLNGRILVDISQVTDVSSLFKSSHITTIPAMDFSKYTYLGSLFDSCKELIGIGKINISNATMIPQAFQFCTKLTEIPILDTSKVTVLSDAFKSCFSLSDNSLNNILMMCKNSKEGYNKTLAGVGLSPEQIQRCHNLSNYQAFLDAGWTDR